MHTAHVLWPTVITGCDGGGDHDLCAPLVLLSGTAAASDCQDMPAVSTRGLSCVTEILASRPGVVLQHPYLPLDL